MATFTARKMVAKWGMSEHLAWSICRGQQHDLSWAGISATTGATATKTAESIDAEVLKIVSRAYDQAKEIISKHRDAMEKITPRCSNTRLDGKHINDIIEHGRMLTPPPAPLAPGFHPNPKEPLPVKSAVKPQEDEGERVVARVARLRL